MGGTTRAIGRGAVLAGAGSFACVLLADRLYGRVAGAEPEPPAAGEPQGRVAVVVLGVPGSNPLYRAVQRWRVGLALDAAERWRAEQVVFSGGCTRPSQPSEAAQLAALARRRGLDPACIVLEERARTTRENVAASAPLVAGASTVVLVSDAFHASRARAYWREQAGTEGPRLVLADRYRRFDRPLLRTTVTLADLAYRAVTRGRGRAAPL